MKKLSVDLHIPNSVVENWQDTLDLLTKTVHVPIGLIMQIKEPNIEVLVSSDGNKNFLNPGDKMPLEGTFCEQAYKTNNYIIIPDVHVESKWENNPIVEKGIVSYLGFPIHWPNGKIFGTLCLNDFVANEMLEDYLDLVDKFRELIESQLEILCLKNEDFEIFCNAV